MSCDIITFILGVAAFVYMGSCTFAGTDLAVGVSLVFNAGIVLASALTGSILVFGGSDGS